jgi:hypothetical protein
MDPIRDAAENVLKNLDLWKLPVDPIRIIEEEGIFLAPSDYRAGFDARIEYFPMFDTFGIYYQEAGAYRNAGRVKFSLAHELGHFYLPEHRQRLRTGQSHNSVADFGSKHPAERQADSFAAHLLMPEELFIAHVNHFHSGFCTLKNLCDMAERLGTSLTSTAIRYCDCGIDATTVVISRDRVVLWSYPSEDMRRLGMWYVASGSTVPAGSQTATLYDRRDGGRTDEMIEGSTDPNIWFQWPKRDKIWEEAMFLGSYVLTYLAAPND